MTAIKTDDSFISLLKVTNLPHHAVPNIIDLLAMFAICDQVKIIGELYISGNLLQDVYTKALAALLDIGALRGITAAYTGTAI